MIEVATQSPSFVDFLGGGLGLGLVMGVIVRPLLASALKNQERSLDLLEKSVKANAEAVEVFRSFERDQSRNMSTITQVQNEILHTLVAMQERLVGRPT